MVLEGGNEKILLSAPPNHPKWGASLLRGAEAEFFYKLYLATQRQAWRWASPSEIAKEIRSWGDLHDVCVYVSPLARAGGEYVFLPIVDIDASKDTPHAACDAAFLLFDEQERDLFLPVLSGQKGLKLVPLFFLPLELHLPCLLWLRRKQKEAKIEELGAEIDFNPLRQRLDVDNPPQPQRLWGLRGKNNTPPGEPAPWVSARPATWTEVARIGLLGRDAYEKIVRRRPTGEEIAEWTLTWASSLRPAPAWLTEELNSIKQQILAKKCYYAPNFPKDRKKFSFSALLTYLAQKGYDFRLKPGGTSVVFCGPCPVCGQKYKAWARASDGRLFCKRQKCRAWEGRSGLPLREWLPGFSYINTKNEKEQDKNVYTLDEAEEKVEQVIKEFFESNKDEIIVLAADAGVTKTKTAMQLACDYADKVATIIAFENYERCEEQHKKTKDCATVRGIELKILRSRHQEGMCQNLDAVRLAEARGEAPAQTVCPVCPFKDSCLYYLQYKQIKRKKNIVFLTTHDYLSSAVRELRKKGFGIIKVILDDWHETKSYNKYTVNLFDLLRLCQRSRFFKKAGLKIIEKLVKLITEENLIRRKVKGEFRCYFTPPAFGELAKSPSLQKLLNEELPFEGLKKEIKSFLKEYNTALARKGYFSKIKTGNELLLKALQKIAEGKGYINLKFYYTWEEVTLLPSNCLILSATPAIEAIKKLIPDKSRLNIEEIKTEGLEKAIKMHVDLAYTKNKKNFNQYIPALTEGFRQLKYAGKKELTVFVLAHKKNKLLAAAAVRQALRKANIKQFKVIFEPLHHFNARGSNIVENCNTIVIFGQPAINPLQLWDLACAFSLDEQEAYTYAYNFSRREAYQEAHRLRLTRSNWGEKTVFFVGKHWPFDVNPGLVVTQQGRPRKGTNFSPVHLTWGENSVLKCLITVRRLLINNYIRVTKFFALPTTESKEKQKKTTILPKILTKEDENAKPPPSQAGDFCFALASPLPSQRD